VNASQSSPRRRQQPENGRRQNHDLDTHHLSPTKRVLLERRHPAAVGVVPLGASRVRRAGALVLPMMVAIIGGEFRRFRPDRINIRRGNLSNICPSIMERIFAGVVDFSEGGSRHVGIRYSLSSLQLAPDVIPKFPLNTSSKGPISLPVVWDA
jgi:hypothetical protein